MEDNSKKVTDSIPTHQSVTDILRADISPELKEVVKTVLGTRYAEYEFCTSNHPFMLHGKEFKLDETEPRPFFSEILVHDIPGDAILFETGKRSGGWLRVRTVRYPDMTPLGLHPHIVLMFIDYCDGYMSHSYEGLYDASAIKFIFGIASGEHYLQTLEADSRPEDK